MVEISGWVCSTNARTWNRITGNAREKGGKGRGKKEKRKRNETGPNNRKIEEIIFAVGRFQKANGAETPISLVELATLPCAILFSLSRSIMPLAISIRRTGITGEWSRFTFIETSFGLQRENLWVNYYTKKGMVILFISCRRNSSSILQNFRILPCEIVGRMLNI